MSATTELFLVLLVVGVAVWIVLAVVVASYGEGRGYPFAPLLICGLVLGWALVLLAVVIGTGPRRRGVP